MKRATTSTGDGPSRPRMPWIFLAICALLHAPGAPVGAGTIQAAVDDVVDGYIVAKVTDNGVPVDAQDGLTWDIVSGQATISEDPYTKVTLFKPVGTVPVIAIPRIGSSAGSQVQVGIDPAILPPGQQTFAVAGGGLCQANPNHGLAFAVDVRSVLTSNVIPLSLTERMLVYQHGEYYAYDSSVGPMRITLNPNFTSYTLLTSQQPAGSGFFPATAQSQFYFNIQFLNSGLTVFNKDPMTFSASDTQWPPFGTTLKDQSPVTFYLANAPTTPFMTIQNQYMNLYSYSQLDISALTFHIDPNGYLTSTWQITNETTDSETFRWFFIGDLGHPSSPSFGAVDIGPGGTVTVTFDTFLGPSTLTQFLTLGAVSQSGPRITGSGRVNFSFVPEPSGFALLGVGTLGLLGHVLRRRNRGGPGTGTGPG